ncbi:MAG: PilZ domain-containing protein [Spirochaetes bacterium]|nr:PilZ domain-containing protein [Spirochaetota bacterium]
MAVVVIIIISLLLIMVYFYVAAQDNKVGGWTEFFSMGQELGFSVKETETLKRLASTCNVVEPCKIYSSQDQLDPCIRLLVQEAKNSGENDAPGTQDFLSKLYDHRKKIEMKKSHSKDSISSSRQIGPGQALRVLVPGHGVFKSNVVNTTTENLIISISANNKFEQEINWPDCKLSVYFWRESDAGYVLDTHVVKETVINGIHCLILEHSDALFRTQKRKSIRIKLRKPAFLYLANPHDENPNFESEMGVVCYLEDISDTGCAFLIAGQAEADIPVKIQFLLNEKPICMIGTVRSVEFMEGSNQSLVRVEASPATVEMRNLIFGEVFGTQGEEDGDLPFRVSDKEMEEHAAAHAVAHAEARLESAVNLQGEVKNDLEGDFDAEPAPAPEPEFGAAPEMAGIPEEAAVGSAGKDSFDDMAFEDTTR